MTDNTVANAGSGGVTFATDEIGGVMFQRVKLVHGVDGTNDGDVATTNPLPVTVSGVATATKQDTGNTSLASIDGKTPALGQALAAVSVPVVLTAIQVAALTPPAAITGFATETGNLAALLCASQAQQALMQAQLRQLTAAFRFQTMMSGGFVPIQEV